MADKKKISSKTITTESIVKSDNRITANAINEAIEEQEIINEKRVKDPTKSRLASQSAEVYDETIDQTVLNPSLVEPSANNIAKAGKRSKKSLEDEQQKLEKEKRKVLVNSNDIKQESTKQRANPTRSKLVRRSKQYQEKYKLIEKNKIYDIKEAVELIKKISYVKFDATVELHFNLNVDPRHADQNIRDNFVLPAGSGKKVKIAVLTDNIDDAKASGADLTESDRIIAQLEKGIIDFDILISTPAHMVKLTKFARLLGPRGLMPNPKSGTVTTDLNKAVNEARAGKIEYRVDSTGIVHVGIGKISFTAVQLMDNVMATIQSIKNNKPASIKSAYIKSIFITSSMSPSLRVNLNSLN